MTVRTFWHLIIKSMGIWIVIHGIMSLPELVLDFLTVYNAPYGTSEVIAFQILFLIVPVIFYLFVLRFLVLKSQSVIDLLKLEKGFEEAKIDISLSYNKILRIIIILIGGILLITAIPNLFENLYTFLRENLPFNASPRATSLIAGIFQSITGFLIMTNSDIVQQYINKKSGEAESKQLDKDDF